MSSLSTIFPPQKNSRAFELKYFMKPLIQKLPLDEGSSLVARIYETPNFEVPWHQHVEVELIMFNKSSVTAFVGDHIGEYQQRDIYFFSKNLPHGFRKQREEMTGNGPI